MRNGINLLEFSAYNAWQFIIIGLATGFLGGFLGVGGGVILIPLLAFWVFPAMKVSPEVIVHLAFGTSLAIIIPTSISGSFAHAKKEAIDWRSVFLLAIPGIIGSFSGSTIAAFLKGHLLKMLFGALLIFLAAQMFWEKATISDQEENEEIKKPYAFLIIGFIVGLFSGFFGLGGGVLIIPLLVRILKIPIHRAMGISIAFVFFVSLIGTLGYIVNGWGRAQLPPYTWGYVHIWGWIMGGLPSVFLARLGTKLAYKIRPYRLRKVFALLLLAMGARMLL